jgi:peptide/nickel transport system substrate-binding protein
MDALQIAMQRGEVEWQMRDKFSPEAFTSMFNDPRFKIVSAQGSAFWLYSFSERAADFGGSLMQKNPKFRQAFAMAIDRKEHVDVFELGNGTVINTPIAMHGWFQKPEWADMYPRDVEAAKALLAEIGWDPNEEVEVLTIEVAYLRKYMAAHQQWLADVGIKMKPVFVDGVAFDEKYLSGDYQIIYIADGAPGDPDVWLSSRLMTGGGMQAITGYGDAALDAQILAGRTSDLAERIRVYQEISERLLIDLPYIPMYVPNNRWVISKKFHWPLISALPEATSVRDVPVASSFQGGDTVRWHVEEWDILD